MSGGFTSIAPGSRPRLWRAVFRVRLIQVLGSGGLMWLAADAPVHSQEVSLRGSVVQSSGQAPIAGASVRITGYPPATTDAQGVFEFRRLRPGPYALSIQAFGYLDRLIEIQIRADTTVQIELAPDPLLMDSVLARARTVTIRGRVRDAVTGLRPAHGVRLIIEPGHRAFDAQNASFTIPSVPAGDTIGILVETFEYLPKQLQLVARNDTSIVIDVHVDSAALRMMAQQVARLQRRIRGVEYSVRTLNRDQVYHSGLLLGELIRRHLPPGAVSSRPPYHAQGVCVTYDDRAVSYAEVATAPAQLIERVEIVGQRGRMLRVYSKAYVAQLMNVHDLPPIVYIATGLQSVCS